jgi:hypothetical protein
VVCALRDDRGVADEKSWVRCKFIHTARASANCSGTMHDARIAIFEWRLSRQADSSRCRQLPHPRNGTRSYAAAVRVCGLRRVSGRRGLNVARRRLRLEWLEPRRGTRVVAGDTARRHGDHHGRRRVDRGPAVRAGYAALGSLPRGWAAMNGRRCHAKGRPAWQYGLVGGAGAVREPPTSRSRSRSRRACETLNPPSPRLGQIERAADLPCATVGDVPQPPGIATVTATSFGEGEHDGTRGTFDLIGGLGAVAAQLRNHGTQRANEIECDLIRDTRSTRACSAGEGVEVLSGRKRLLPTTSAAGRRP